jgi:peptide/nickel transport system substrate-binding protein
MRSLVRRRAVALSAVAAAVCLVAAACTSGPSTPGSGKAAVGKAMFAGPVNPAHYSASATAFRIANLPWTSGTSYNPYSPNPEPFLNLSLLNLAAYSNTLRPGANPYLPELASGWTVGPHQITFSLRQGAKWQDNTPFTTTDVVDSFLLAGADGNSVWADISSLTVPSSHQVVVNLHPWVVTENALAEIMTISMLPASQYGHLIYPGLTNDLLTYWHIYNFLSPTKASIAAASSSPAGKAMLSAGTALAKFSPSTLIGNGPYTIQSSSISGILYKKWMGWWGQSVIRAPWVQIIPASSSAAYGDLLGGNIDAEYFAQFPDPQVTNLNYSQKGRYFFIPSPVQQESLVFHLADYPYGMLQVRQALAYVITRTTLTQLDMGGSLIQNPPATAPDGINDAMAVPKYITESQLKSMNQYNYNPAKAAQLLQSVGFTKKNGVWHLPNGNVWNVTITEEAGYSQFIQDGLAIVTMLEHFGIKADEVTVNAGTYVSQQEAGDFAISEEFMDWGGTPNPLADFSATFAPGALPAWNYPIWYNGNGPFQGTVAIGIGPVSNVPGLGKVNVGAALNQEVNEAPKSEWAKYTYDWARWIDQNLPLLPLYNNAFHIIYGTTRYTDFPPKSANWLWTVLGGAAEIVVQMQAGYLQMG